MKKLLLTTLITFVGLNAQIVTIVDKGVERKIYIPDDNSTIIARSTDTEQPKKELIIAFKNSIDINKFASKYNLELKTDISKKYYIFKNKSNLDVASLIAKIILNEKDIQTIRPNWGFGFKAR